MPCSECSGSELITARSLDELFFFPRSRALVRLPADLRSDLSLHLANSLLSVAPVLSRDDRPVQIADVVTDRGRVFLACPPDPLADFDALRTAIRARVELDVPIGVQTWVAPTREGWGSGVLKVRVSHSESPEAAALLAFGAAVVKHS